MQGGVTVRHALVRGDFRRLLGTRLASQFGDGVFQAALAGTVLFNPERAAHPVDIAAGFAVLLLPYSSVGPFAGVWLDRWSRRQVLLRANVVRAGLVTLVATLIAGGVGGVPFLLAGLAVFSVNRFVLAALSAALPHTVDGPGLVSANALSTTSGALATVAGGGAALGVVHLIGTGDGGYAFLALGSALPYLTAATVVAGFDRGHLGPDSELGTAATGVRDVARGMVAGARHVWARRPAAAGLVVITLHRFGYGLLTLMTLLLYRNTFVGLDGLFPGGMTGLGEVLAAGGAGTLVAAAVTPRAVRSLGKASWVALLLTAAACAQLGLGLPLLPETMVPAWFVLSLAAQGIKICVDTTLQETIGDDYRGRVFSVYDTLFNVTFVIALLTGAVLLPESGVSPALLLAVGVSYLLIAVLYRRPPQRSGSAGVTATDPLRSGDQAA